MKGFKLAFLCSLLLLMSSNRPLQVETEGSFMHFSFLGEQHLSTLMNDSGANWHPGSDSLLGELVCNIGHMCPALDSAY